MIVKNNVAYTLDNKCAYGITNMVKDSAMCEILYTRKSTVSSSACIYSNCVCPEEG